MLPIRTQSITFRHVLIYAITFVCILAFVGYVIFQARFVIEGPQIMLTNNSPVAHTDRIVTLEGKARNIVHMTLNGRQIYTDMYGNFKEAVVLENGYTIATLEAQDRYGRTTTLTKQFVHVAAGPDQLSINSK